MLRALEPARIVALIREHRVTHFNGAPTVLLMIAEAPEARGVRFEPRVRVATGGSPPSPTILARMDALGVDVTHLYGLTETYGPHVFAEPQPGWEALDPDARARVMARQGVPGITATHLRVVDAGMRDVPADGETMGEVVMRGNNVMKGYYEDPAATAQAFAGGWFHSGDLGVMHADGYIELRDRQKDIIISGGENISTIEVEHTVVKHPAVLECAVVSMPHEKWGEVPKAYVSLRPGSRATEQELIDFCRAAPGAFQVPEVNRVRRAAEDLDGQDPEVRAAREGLGGHGAAHPVAPVDSRRAGRRARGAAESGGGESGVRIVNVVGARPNFMKIAPLMDAYARAPELEPLLVHTGQHYDAQDERAVLPPARDPASRTSTWRSAAAPTRVQTAEIMKALRAGRAASTSPHAVLVVGDVNSTIACGLVAVKLGVKLVHVEAGLRSFDRDMPEEINRVLTDAISDLLFCTEQSGVENLRREGVAAEQDPPRRQRDDRHAAAAPRAGRGARRSSRTCGLRARRLRRADAAPALQRGRPRGARRSSLDVLEVVLADLPLVFPVHPRTRQNLADSGLLARVAAQPRPAARRPARLPRLPEADGARAPSC